MHDTEFTVNNMVLCISKFGKRADFMFSAITTK